MFNTQGNKLLLLIVKCMLLRQMSDYYVCSFCHFLNISKNFLYMISEFSTFWQFLNAVVSSFHCFAYSLSPLKCRTLCMIINFLINGFKILSCPVSQVSYMFHVFCGINPFVRQWTFSNDQFDDFWHRYFDSICYPQSLYLLLLEPSFKSSVYSKRLCFLRKWIDILIRCSVRDLTVSWLFRSHLENNALSFTRLVSQISESILFWDQISFSEPLHTLRK